MWFPEPLMTLEDGTPITIQQVVMGHTGCTSLDGPFPVFDGSFDGQSFYTESTFDCEIPEHWPDNDLFETPVDGLLNWKWTYDLTMATLPETGGAAFPVQAALVGLGGLAAAAGLGIPWLGRRRRYVPRATRHRPSYSRGRPDVLESDSGHAMSPSLRDSERLGWIVS